MAQMGAQVPWQVTQKVRSLPRKAAQRVETAMQITASQHPLVWITPWGARLMLQVAWEEEGMAFRQRDGLGTSTGRFLVAQGKQAPDAEGSRRGCDDHHAASAGSGRTVPLGAASALPHPHAGSGRRPSRCSALHPTRAEGRRQAVGPARFEEAGGGLCYLAPSAISPGSLESPSSGTGSAWESAKGLARRRRSWGAENLDGPLGGSEAPRAV